MRNFILNIAIAALVGAVVALGVIGFSNQSDQELGGGTRFIHGLSTNSTSPSAGEVKTTTLTVDGASALTSISVSGASVVATLTEGGGIRATSTVGTVVPLLASDFDVENIIDVTLNVQDATLSFPATSTLTAFIPTAGQVRTLFIRNATTTATMDLTISGGTGVLLKMASSTNVAIVPGDTDGANYAKIELLRKSNTDIEAL